MEALAQRVINSKAESGQAIVLVAIIMIILIASLGLAIDGGALFRLFRDAQDAVDSAALAAAVAQCTTETGSSSIPDAARRSAANNGFVDGVDGTVVFVHTPPQEGPHTNQNDFVQVIIEAENDPIFIDVVYSGPLSVRVRATAFCDRGSAAAASALDQTTIFAGSQVCNQAVNIAGSQQTIYGGVHSNNDQKWGGSDSTVYGNVNMHNTLDGSGTNNNFYEYEEPPATQNISNPHTEGVAVIPMPQIFTLEEFDESTDAAALQATTNGDVYVKYDICSNPNDSMDANWLETEGYLDPVTGRLDDGIYYSECNIQLNVNMSSTAGVSQVTFVAEGSVDFSGSEHNMVAYYENLLIYSNLDRNPTGDGGNQCSNSVVQFSGSTHSWTGLIYAPNGQVQMSGSTNDA